MLANIFQSIIIYLMTVSNHGQQEIELSIILLSYNTAILTKKCIESIIKEIGEQMKYEIIVFDNDSTDETVTVIKKLAIKNNNLKYFHNKENLGFAKGNNRAVTHAKGKYLLFLNTDTVVLDNAVARLFKYYKENEETLHFLGGKLLNNDRTDQPSCGLFYSLPVVFAALFLKGDYWGLTRSSPNEAKKVDWVSGACIMTRKDIFKKLGGFDKKIFMYMEEIDLLYRAAKQDLKTYFYPEARFVHLGSASSAGRTFPILQVYKGLIYFYKKHHSTVAFAILKGMLQLKALLLVGVGRLTKNSYLVKTYEHAYKITEMV